MSFRDKVLEFAERYLENVRPSGDSNLKARCPFHSGGNPNDRTLSINLHHGAWICFHSKCGRSGSFVELLQEAGLTPQQVQRMYESIPREPDLPSYLAKNAKLKKEVVTLPDYILGAYQPLPDRMYPQFDRALLEQFELRYDATNERVIFPIRDFRGRLAALNGRAIHQWVSPKYKVYHARRGGELEGVVDGYVADNRLHLYGLHTFYEERYPGREGGTRPPIILVEGYKACLWLRQHGYTDTVALQGSSLSESQKTLLQRFSGPFLVLLDHQAGKNYPDRFGRWAALQIAEELRRSGRVFMGSYHRDSKENTQPDDLNYQELEELLNNVKTPTQLILENQ